MNEPRLGAEASIRVLAPSSRAIVVQRAPKPVYVCPCVHPSVMPPGFGAAVSGCFFALESVLRGSAMQGSPPSLATAMILLASVLAAVVSEQGLGAEPAVKVPLYEFRSPAGQLLLNEPCLHCHLLVVWCGTSWHAEERMLARSFCGDGREVLDLHCALGPRVPVFSVAGEAGATSLHR